MEDPLDCTVGFVESLVLSVGFCARESTFTGLTLVDGKRDPLIAHRRMPEDHQ